jgi:hypothetical protein
VDELIAIQASLWGQSAAIGENVNKAIEIYNPKFWRTAGLGAKRLVGLHFSYMTNQYCPVNLRGLGQKANSGGAFRVT